MQSHVAEKKTKKEPVTLAILFNTRFLMMTYNNEVSTADLTRGQMNTASLNLSS